VDRRRLGLREGDDDVLIVIHLLPTYHCERTLSHYHKTNATGFHWLALVDFEFAYQELTDGFKFCLAIRGTLQPECVEVHQCTQVLSLHI
jgi:hypothetical protein